MKEGKKVIPVILTVVLSAILFVNSTEAATWDQQNTTSNVTVNVYVSISLTTDLSSGVTFGSLEPATNDNPSTTCSNGACNVTVSADTNVNVDIVLRANATLTDTTGSYTIPIAGYTWNSTDGTENPGTPGFALDDTQYDYTNKVGDSVGASGVRNWQAWLDIPSAQTAGVYFNTLSFCGCEEDQNTC
jgi:hypothetical protein